MSPLTLSTPSTSRPSNPQDQPILSTRGQGQEVLPTRIERQRTRIREEDQLAEELRLVKVKEREQKQELREQQDQQRRIERQRRDEAAA